jgi:hypothetical protein
MGAMHHAHHAGIKPLKQTGAARRAREFLETKWQEPDEGIWEVRGAAASSRIRK